MGAECRKAGDLHTAQEFSVIQPQVHPAFGNIFYLRCDHSRLEKAVKRLTNPTQSMLEAIKRRIQFVKECDNSMTLVQIYNFDIIDKYSEDLSVWESLPASKTDFSCNAPKNEPYALIHFQYYSPERCLSSILKSRRGQLQRLGAKYGKGVVSDARAVQMWNYSQIDNLSSHVRQVVNVYYQEIEVVRMIDHIIGAVYFLHHFDVTHAALRPQQVLVDDDGHFVLVDREVFMRRSNYELALEWLHRREEGENDDADVLNYLAPEHIPNLKNKVEDPQLSQEKADIFCVGLLALTMCLLDEQQRIFEYAPYLKTIRINQTELTRKLVRMKERYSEPFADLLQQMLKKDPVSRIDFAQLIDQLNPLLQANLEAIKRVHSIDHKQEHREQEEEDTYEYGGRVEEEQLRSRLATMQKEFQKVMNNRMMLYSRNPNECDLRNEEGRILDKLEKIKTARSEISTKAKIKKAPQVSRSKAGDKRYISGKELQQIVWKEYENIKSRRNYQK